MSNQEERRKGMKFNNVWQTLLLITAILIAGWSLNDKLEEAIFTEDEVKVIATTAAKEVIYDHKKDIAVTDADDFMRGWINSDGLTMDEYIEHTFEFKTRVYKGGALMIENEFDTREEMCNKYGDRVVNDLVEKLIRFNN